MKNFWKIFQMGFLEGLDCRVVSECPRLFLEGVQNKKEYPNGTGFWKKLGVAILRGYCIKYVEMGLGSFKSIPGMFRVWCPWRKVKEFPFPGMLAWGFVTTTEEEIARWP